MDSYITETEFQILGEMLDEYNINWSSDYIFDDETEEEIGYHIFIEGEIKVLFDREEN